MKTISLHLERCWSGSCPHSKVCYMKNRKLIAKEAPSIDWLDMVTQGAENMARAGEAKVYWSMCSWLETSPEFLKMIEDIENWSVTVPVALMDHKELATFAKEHPDRVQITVYNIGDAVQFDEYQKLFLVKDYTTLKDMKWMMGICNKIHFPVHQGWADKDKVKTVIELLGKCPNDTVSVDSCLENYVVNGECLYQKDYIDINWDGTCRKCVFDPEGIDVRSMSFEEIMNISDSCSSKGCLYTDTFKGDKE